MANQDRRTRQNESPASKTQPPTQVDHLEDVGPLNPLDQQSARRQRMFVLLLLLLGAILAAGAIRFLNLQAPSQSGSTEATPARSSQP